MSRLVQLSIALLHVPSCNPSAFIVVLPGFQLSLLRKSRGRHVERCQSSRPRIKTYVCLQPHHKGKAKWQTSVTAYVRATSTWIAKGNSRNGNGQIKAGGSEVWVACPALVQVRLIHDTACCYGPISLTSCTSCTPFPPPAV